MNKILVKRYVLITTPLPKDIIDLPVGSLEFPERIREFYDESVDTFESTCFMDILNYCLQELDYPCECYVYATHSSTGSYCVGVL